MGNSAGYTETLPTQGSSYVSVSSNIDDSQVEELERQPGEVHPTGRRLLHLRRSPPPARQRLHTFSGTLRDEDLNDRAVEWIYQTVTVQAAAQQADASASRSFNPATVRPGADPWTVTIRVSDYGSGGGVTETLPTGFTYQSSSLPSSQVMKLSGNQVRFTLQMADLLHL